MLKIAIRIVRMFFIKFLCGCPKIVCYTFLIFSIYKVYYETVHSFKLVLRLFFTKFFDCFKLFFNFLMFYICNKLLMDLINELLQVVKAQSKHRDIKGNRKTASCVFKGINLFRSDVVNQIIRFFLHIRNACSS